MATTKKTTEDEEKKLSAAGSGTTSDSDDSSSQSSTSSSTSSTQSTSRVTSTPTITDTTRQRYGVTAISNYDPNADDNYQSALQALRQAQESTPTYAATWDDEVANLYQQITGREDFKYDLNNDTLYQAYKDQYTQLGKQAMMDTMGQAAALTGGYGSTYSQSAGQQQYNAYLQDLTSAIPDYYDRAYQVWSDKGDELYNRYSLARDAQDTEYNQYRDSMSDYYNNLDYATSQEQQAYSRGEDAWNRDYQLNQDAYEQQEAEQERLQNLMAIGYTPTNEEFTAAGMSEAEGAAWLKYIKKQNSSSSSSSSTGLTSNAKKYYNKYVNVIMDTDYGDTGAILEMIEVDRKAGNITASEANAIETEISNNTEAAAKMQRNSGSGW